MGGIRRRALRGERGAQAVEFALIFVLVLGPVLYYLIAFGFVMSDQITASQMAREIARSYSICYTQSGQTQTSCNSAAQTLFTSTEISSWTKRGATVSPDQSTNGNCFMGSKVQTVTVSVNPVLKLYFAPGLSKIQGKATTPCGG